MINIRCILAIFIVLSATPAIGGTFVITTSGGKSGLNTSHTVSVDLTYYYNVYTVFTMDTTIAAGGYFTGSSYIDIYCDGFRYVNSKNSNRVIAVPANKEYTIYLNNGSSYCQGSNTTVKWQWGNWIGPVLGVSDIEIWGTKDAPNAPNQTINLVQGGSTAQMTLPASDNQNAPISFEVSQQPAKGQLTWDGWKYVYTSDPCFSGTDSFKYRVTESIKGQQTEGTVTLNISPSSTPPPTIASIADVTIPWYRPLTINLSGIVKGLCGGVVTVTATSSNPAILPHPVVSYSNPNSTGSITLTPKQPMVIADSNSTITVTVSDGLQSLSRNFVTTVKWVNIFFRK